MQIVDNSSKIQEVITKRFSKKRKSVRDNIALSILSLIQSESCALPEIAVQMSSINGCAAPSNELRISRFLKAKTFQIDDNLWRTHISVVFDLLRERGFLNEGRKIAINVDFTSSTDDFSILSASIPFQGRAIPLYFSMRNYPKKKNSFNQKKMEEAFIKELSHLLSNKYSYVIVADRGFGNGRFVNICISKGFCYILRTKDNLKISEDEFSNIKKLKDFFISKFDFPNAKVLAWNKKVRLIKTSNKDSSWHIVTNIDKASFNEIVDQYGHRFKCEKMFQDHKSSGFNIEKSKIKKYDRFKRLLYLISLSQTLMMFIGDYINDNVDEIKKKFRLHIDLISAFSN